MRIESIPAIQESVAILPFSYTFYCFKEFLLHFVSETCPNKGKIFANFKGGGFLPEEIFIIKNGKNRKNMLIVQLNTLLTRKWVGLSITRTLSM